MLGTPGPGLVEPDARASRRRWPPRPFLVPSGGETQGPPAVVRLAPLLGAAAAVGVVSGFLELLSLVVQLHVLHRVSESFLRTSRHYAWMVPVAGALMVPALTGLLVGPALALDAWRRRRTGDTTSARWLVPLAGWVLGTLLFLGALLAWRGLHPLAASLLALGAGYRLRRGLVGTSQRWRRAAWWSGVVALGLLAPYSGARWAFVVLADRRAEALPARSAPSLLWIVLDTVRADRMGLYGYHRNTTPELARGGPRGGGVGPARSAAPWTLPSHVTMFTGLWPSEHGARVDRPYHGAPPTLAEFLGAQGHATAGVVANTGMCNARYGVGRGFDHYLDLWSNHEVSLNAVLSNSALGDRALGLLRALDLPAPPELPRYFCRRAPAIIGEAWEWLDAHARTSPGGAPRRDRPFFLFLNFMDAHGPYLPISSTPRLYSADRPMPKRPEALPTRGWDALRAVWSAPPEDRPRCEHALKETTRWLGDLYDDCLRGLDADVGRFLDDLHAAGLLDDTWVVITSDHGEYLGEHELFGHACGLHDEVTRVPLVLIPPMRGDDERARSMRGRRMAVPVAQRDLPATLASLLLPGVSHPFPGRSLERHWRDERAEAPDPVLSQLENQPLTGGDTPVEHYISANALIHEERVLVQEKDRAPMFFHLRDDPDRWHDIAAQPSERERLDRLTRALEGITRRPRAR